MFDLSARFFLFGLGEKIKHKKAALISSLTRLFIKPDFLTNAIVWIGAKHGCFAYHDIKRFS